MTIYTLGHSRHPADFFVALLRSQRVNCVVDVRSIAASRFNPQYNKTNFAAFLKQHNIQYLHFADEFGARRTDPFLLDENGKVDFEKVRKSATFLSGIERLKTGSGKGFTIALVCAEAEPMDCHRFAMICPALVQEGFTIKHILADKRIKTNAKLEEELLLKYAKKLTQLDISMREQEDILRAAYRLRNLDIAYAPGHPGQE